MRSIGWGKPGAGYPAPRNAEDGGSAPGLNVPNGKSFREGSDEDVNTLGVVTDFELDVSVVISLVFVEELLVFSFDEWLFSEGVAGVFLPTTAGDVRGETAL